LAKGDHDKIQNQLDTKGSSAWQNLTDPNTGLYNQTQQTTNSIAPYYGYAANQGIGNYNNIMGGYQNFLNPGSGSSQPNYGSPYGGSSSGYSSSGGDAASYFQQKFPTGSTLSPDMLTANEADLNAHGIQLVRNAEGVPGKIKTPDGHIIDVIQGAGNGTNKSQWLDTSAGGGGGSGSGSVGDFGTLDPAIAGYMNFAQNGGFSPQDIQDMRARGVASTRSIYSGMKDNLDTARNASGGYMPNYAAASAKMARQGSQQISDINQSTDAQIAQMVQQGKLAGIGGLSNLSAILRSQYLQGLAGQGSLYGTQPGMASTFGNQYLEGQGQQLQGQGLINQLQNNLVNQQLGIAGDPTGWQSFSQNVGNIGTGIGNFGRGIGSMSGN